MQSIEHALRTLDRVVEEEGNNIRRLEKTLANYQAQAHRLFEHEGELKELLARQARLNATLDLDKSDAQAAEQESEADLDTAPALPRPADPVDLGPRLHDSPVI